MTKDDWILLTFTQKVMLQELKKREGQWIKFQELRATAGLSKTRAHSLLTVLVKGGIISKQKVGIFVYYSYHPVSFALTPTDQPRDSV